MADTPIASNRTESSSAPPTSQGYPKPICFISHAWDDSRINDVVMTIRKSLNRSFDVVTDMTCASGANNPQTLLASIRNASLFVCILDNLRPNVILELGYALAHDIPLILLLHEDATVDVRSFLDDSGRTALPLNPRLRPAELRIHLGMLGGSAPKIYSTVAHGRELSPVAHIRDELDRRYGEAPTLREAVYDAYFRRNPIPANLKDVVTSVVREQNPLIVQEE